MFKIMQDGRSALHWAASSGSLEIVRYLIDQKATVDLPDNSGWTSLHIAGIIIHFRQLITAFTVFNEY